MTALVVGGVLLVLTPLFARLPLNVMGEPGAVTVQRCACKPAPRLIATRSRRSAHAPHTRAGAIVISGVSGLFEYEQAVHLFRVSGGAIVAAVQLCTQSNAPIHAAHGRRQQPCILHAPHALTPLVRSPRPQVRKLDWLVWMASLGCTMFLGVEVGLAISIGLALLIVIYESAFPHTAMLGRIGGTTVFRNVKQFPDSQARAARLRRAAVGADDLVAPACAHALPAHACIASCAISACALPLTSVMGSPA